MAETHGDQLALILLNYRRPQNVGRIARAVIDAIPGVGVYILDQAETDGLRARDDIPWGRVWYRKADFNGRAGARIRLASQLPHRYFMALDDDVFPEAHQVTGLFEGLRQAPDRAHGLYGKFLFRNAEGGVGISGGDCYQGPVSMIHMAYAFDKAHVGRTMALAAEMGFPDWEHVRFGDDILLSAAGLKPPMGHNLGRMEICPTFKQEGIALQAETDFQPIRGDMLRWLLDRNRLLVATPRASSSGEVRAERGGGF